MRFHYWGNPKVVVVNFIRLRTLPTVNMLFYFAFISSKKSFAAPTFASDLYLYP